MVPESFGPNLCSALPFHMSALYFHAFFLGQVLVFHTGVSSQIFVFHRAFHSTASWNWICWVLIWTLGRSHLLSTQLCLGLFFQRTAVLTFLVIAFHCNCRLSFGPFAGDAVAMNQKCAIASFIIPFSVFLAISHCSSQNIISSVSTCRRRQRTVRFT